MLEWAKVSWSSRAICSPCAWVSTVPPNLPCRSHIQAADRLLEGLVCATASLPMRAADPQKQELHTQVPVLQCSRCTLQHLWKCREGLCVRWASLTPPTCVSACLPGSVLFLNVGQCFISLCHCLFVYSKQLQARGLGFALKWHPVVDLLRSSFAQWEGCIWQVSKHNWPLTRMKAVLFHGSPFLPGRLQRSWLPLLHLLQTLHVEIKSVKYRREGLRL